MTIYLKNKYTLKVDDFNFKCCIGKHGVSKNKVEDVLCAFGEIQLHLKEDRAVLRTATESFDYFGYIVTKHPLKTT